jgi:pimeloyl-ACP methyl ester carboxylesterase
MFDGFFDFMQKGSFKDMPQIYKDAFLKVNPDEKKLMTMYNKDRQRMLDFKDWSDASLKSIQSPVLLMVGDKDVVRPEHCMEMARIIPNARLAVVPGNHGDFIGEAMSAPVDYKKIESSLSIIQEFLNAN